MVVPRSLSIVLRFLVLSLNAVVLVEYPQLNILGVIFADKISSEGLIE